MATKVISEECLSSNVLQEKTISSFKGDSGHKTAQAQHARHSDEFYIVRH